MSENKVLKGCRLAPSAKGQMSWISRQKGRSEEGYLGASRSENLCVTMDGPSARG